MAVDVNEIAFDAFRTGILVETQRRAVLKTNVAAQDMGAGDTANFLLAEAGKGGQGFIHDNNLAIHAQDRNADGNLIKQFEKIDRDIEKIVDGWQRRDAPSGP